MKVQVRLKLCIAFNNNNFFDWVLRIQILPNLLETKSNSEGGTNIVVWAHNRKRQREDIKKETGTRVCVCVCELIVECNSVLYNNLSFFHSVFFFFKCGYFSNFGSISKITCVVNKLRHMNSYYIPTSLIPNNSYSFPNRIAIPHIKCALKEIKSHNWQGIYQYDIQTLHQHLLA